MLANQDLMRGYACDKDVMHALLECKSNNMSPGGEGTDENITMQEL
jgi:hypothetical protein